MIGGLALVFGSFYGVRQLRNTPTRGAAAQVNGHLIHAGEFEFTRQNQEEYYEKMFNGTVPDGFRDQVAGMALQSLVQRELITSAAQAWHMAIADSEVADDIRKISELTDDHGDFKLEVYKRFITRVQKQYHFDYEDMLRRQLLASRTMQIFPAITYVSDSAAHDTFVREKTEWTYSVVRIDPKPLVDAKKIATNDDAKAIADRMQAAWNNPVERKQLLDAYGLTVTTVGPFTIAHTEKLAGTSIAESDLAAVLRVNTPHAMCPAPLNAAGVWVVCALDKRTTPDDAAWTTAAAEFHTTLENKISDARQNAWLADLHAHAVIKNFIHTDE